MTKPLFYLLLITLPLTARSQCLGVHIQTDGITDDQARQIYDRVSAAYKLIGVDMYLDAIVPGKVEYQQYTSADLLLHAFGYGPQYSDINLYLSSRDMGGGVSYYDMLCLHQQWISSDGKPIGRGPFAVIPEIETVHDAATRTAKKIGYLVGVGELSGPCDGTIMNHSRCADIDNGFGTYADEIRDRVNNAQCLKTTDIVNLSGDLTGYVSGASVTMHDAQVQDMVIAAYEFTMTSGTLDDVEIIQQTCKYLINND